MFGLGKSPSHQPFTEMGKTKSDIGEGQVKNKNPVKTAHDWIIIS